jgi:hypothetical protein
MRNAAAHARKAEDLGPHRKAFASILVRRSGQRT